MHALNPVSARFNEQLKAAMAALHHLDDHGCLVRSIRLGDQRPVITIDRPAQHAFLRGAMRRRERIGQVQRTLIAAPFHGCQVEWEVSECVARQVRQA